MGPNARAARRDEVSICEAAAFKGDGGAVRGSGEFADRVPGHYPELAQVEQDGQQEDIVRERASVKGGGSHLPEKARPGKIFFCSIMKNIVEVDV